MLVNDNIKNSMLSTHELKYIWYLLKKVNFLFILYFLDDLPVGTQRAYFELKYFKTVKMRDAKYSLKLAAEKWRQIFPFFNALYS